MNPLMNFRVNTFRIFLIFETAEEFFSEGGDMIFIDEDPLPTINGTGTEDYFNTAFCPAQEYCAPTTA